MTDTGDHVPLPVPSHVLEAAAKMEIAFEPGEPERLAAFLDLLLATNRRFNLTAITDPDSAWTRHILDSLSLLPVIASIGMPGRIADVGSGGGLPAIPLAILLPGTHVTLIESTGKKARFLREAVAALELSNVTVVTERAEVLGHDREGFRERFPIVTARAVGPLPVLLELTTPLLSPGGCLLAIKGERAADELEASRPALTALLCTHEASIRTATGTIVVIRKGGRTPRIYPRRPGEPKRAPIGSTSA